MSTPQRRQQGEATTSCENIHSWISLSGDLVLSHQQGIYGFKFPKRFWRSLPEISLLLSFFS
jgi:hypothetical protein